MFAIGAADPGPPSGRDGRDGPVDVPAGTSIPAGTCAAGEEIESLSNEALEAELATHAVQIAAAEGRFCLLADEVDRRGFWYAQGARSCAHWLSWRCSMSAGVAREHLRVGRALRTLPAVRAAFLRGELSYSKVRAMTRVATPEIEARLLDYARYATASQLEDIVRGFRKARPDEAQLAMARHRSRELSSYVDTDGMVVIRARLAPEEGAVVLAAIEGAREQLRRDEQDALEARAEAEEAEGAEGAERAEGDGPATHEAARPTGSRAPRREAWSPTVEEGVPAGTQTACPRLAGAADALVAICEQALSGGFAPEHATGPAVSVVVHVDDQVLRDPAAEGCARVEGIAPLSPHTVQRLLCDATVSKVRYEPDGTVVPEGATRQVPPRMRRAVLARDHGCRWPGCARTRRVDVHHVVWVSRGGKTTLSNLATLCRFHHRLVHEGGFGFSMDARGRVEVASPDGVELSRRAVPPAAGPYDLWDRNARAGLDLHARTMPTGGEPYDLDLAVDVLLAGAPASRTT